MLENTITLDDPVGIVHIRDLLAFMTARARVSEATKTKRKKPLPAGLAASRAHGEPRRRQSASRGSSGALGTGRTASETE